MTTEVRVETQDQRSPEPPPRIPGLWALLLSLLAAFYLGLAEIDHILGQIAIDGTTWSPTQLGSLSTLFHPVQATTGWAFFADQAPDLAPHAHTWLRVYSLVDILFVLVYVLIALFIWVDAHGAAETGALILVLGGLADLGEDLVLLLGAGQLGWAVVVFTYLKWAGVLLGLLVLLVAERSRLRSAAGQGLHALYTHRYTLMVVLPLAVLGLAQGTDILEQLPDIQRAWFDQRSVRDPVSAGITLTFVGIAVLYIGRQRTEGLWLRTCDEWIGDVHPHGPDDDCGARARQRALPRSDLHIWFLGPALLAVLGLLLLPTHAVLRPSPFWIFVAVPLAIGVVSWLLRRRLPDSYRPIRGAVSVARYKVTAGVGDALVGTIAVVAGLASIRAFTGLVLLDPHEFGNWFMVGLGLAAVVLTWPIHIRVLRMVDGYGAKTPQISGQPTLRQRLLVALTPGVGTVVQGGEA